MTKPRPICQTCNTRPRAISYTRPSGTIQYRSLCEECRRLKSANRLPKKSSSWEASGYKKKMKCDVCGFTAKLATQTQVWHIDGNLNNADMTNLRTVCLNCTEIVKRKNFTWRRGDLEVD